MASVAIQSEDRKTNIICLHQPIREANDTSVTGQYQQELPKQLTLHTSDAKSLLNRAENKTYQKELALAPVELHKRNIQRRLRESQTPKDSIKCTDPTAVAEQILAVKGRRSATLDRIDRLETIRSLLSGNEVTVASPAVPSEPQTIEQIRTVVENVTGYHPERLEAAQTVVDELTSPLDIDAAEIIEAGITTERILRQNTVEAVSNVESIRRATRQIVASDGDIWQQTYPDVDSLSIVGVSSLPVSYIDLIHALLATVSVSVHIHLRSGTGVYLSHRVSQLIDISDPGTVVFHH